MSVVHVQSSVAKKGETVIQQITTDDQQRTLET